ncbi:Late secretory pathway protein AVL9 -like protein [Trichinella murrelli]|uniref:Late secretory pathway protein AVL9-like protein n=1 Tax=Trichinella murrelli TaxID=144512 RepID=A0A0V0U1C1_9BILA|nr:Late secretory pathway protein AVL9 -like protein [Trichinella murrelli]
MNNEATIGKGLRQYGCCYRAERQCLLILEIYGDGPCWYLFISIVLFICLVDARILPAKRELGKRDSRDGGSQTENMIAQTNPPVVTSASSPSDDRDSSHVGATNEPARESGFQIMEESHSEKINVKSAYSEIVSSPDGHFLENWPTLLSKLQCIDLRDSICEARLRYYAVMKLFIRGSKMPPVKHQLQLQYVRPLVLHCINSTPDGLNILALRCLKMLLLFYTDSCQRLAQKISEFTIPKLISNDDPIRQCAVDVYTLFLKFPRNNSTKQGVHYTEAMRSLLASVYHTLKHAVHNSVTDNDLDERLGNVVPELDFNELENAEQLRGVASALDCLCHLLDQYTPTAVIAIPVEELSATIFYGVNCILSKNTTCSRENRHLFQKLFRLFEVMVSVTNIHYAPYSAGTIAIFNRWMEEQCTGVCGIKSCELKSAVYLSLEALARHVGVGSGLHDRFAFLYRTGLANMLSHLKQICVSLFDLEQLFNQVVPVSTVCSSEVFDSCARFLRTSVQRFGNLIPAEQYSMAQMMIWRALFEMRRNGCFTDATVPSRLMLHRLLNTFLLHPHPRCPSLANMAIGLLKMTVDDQNDQIRSLSAEGLTICERITKPLVPCLESISIWDLEVPNTTWSQDEQRCLQWRSRYNNDNLLSKNSQSQQMQHQNGSHLMRNGCNSTSEESRLSEVDEVEGEYDCSAFNNEDLVENAISFVETQSTTVEQIMEVPNEPVDLVPSSFVNRVNNDQSLVGHVDQLISASVSDVPDNVENVVVTDDISFQQHVENEVELGFSNDQLESTNDLDSTLIVTEHQHNDELRKSPLSTVLSVATLDRQDLYYPMLEERFLISNDNPSEDVSGSSEMRSAETVSEDAEEDASLHFGKKQRLESHELCTVEADAIGEIPCFTFRRIAPLPLNKLAAYLGQSMTGLAMLSFHQPGTYAIYLDVNNHFDPKLIIRDNQNQLSLFTINQEPNGYFWLLLEDIEHAFRTIDHLIRFYMHFRQPLKVPNGDAVFLKRAAVNVGLQFEMCVEHCKKITDLSYFYRAGQLDNVLSRLVCSGDYLLYEDASNQFGCRLYVKWDGNVKEIKPALHNGRLALPVGCSQQHVETVQSFDHWIKALVVGNLDIDNVQLTRPVRVCGDDGPIEFICAVPGQCPPPKLLYQLPYYHGQLKRDAVKLLLNNAGDFLLYMDESDLKLAVGEQSDHGNDDTSYCETTVECSADGYFYLTPVDMPLCKTTVGELINAYKRLAVPITIQKFGENSFTLPALQRGVVRKDINDEIVLEPCNNPSELSYYYGRMSDDDTMKLLRENGDYLLRSNAKGELSVTATWAECLFDIVVEKEKLKGDAYVYKLKKDNANEPDEFVSTVDEWVKSLVRGKVIIDDAVILKKAVKKHNNNNSEQLLIWQLKTLTDRLLELNKKITVEHVYPAINGKTEIADDDLPTLWKTLPSLALPDGAHNHDADFVYFHLPDLSNPNSTVYGVSYVRQIAAKDLREKSNDITRSTVQKSICAVSSSPLYGLLMPKLESISKVYFEQGDFKQTELLAEMYHNINATIDSTTLCGQQPNFGIIDYFLSQSNGWLNGMLLFRIIVRRLSVRELLHTYRHRTLMLFKLVLLEKRIFFNISPVGSLCSNILALISLFPRMIDFGMSHSASYSPLLEDSNLKSDEMNSSKEDNDNSLPLNTSNDDNDDDGSGGDGGGGEQTSECKRNSENRHLSNNTIATELPLDAYGFPLAIFTKGSVLHPYLSLPYMDWLESDHVRAYVVGFTNTLFKQKKELFDAMITIDEENGIDIEIPDVRLRRLLVLSAADLRFIDGVLKTAFQDDSSISQFTKWEGGDEWIRFQFSQYLISLLLTAASDDTSYYDDFNAAFVHSYKTTHNFLLWYSGGFHKQMNFPAGHICHGQLNLADFKLRFTHTIESSDQARKLQHALNTTGNFVNQTGKAVGGIFRNIFNHLTSSSTERSNTP